MMLVLAGLHGAGKSYLSSVISRDFSWEVCVKRDILKLLHSYEGGESDWVAWYRSLYVSIGSYSVTKKLASLIPSRDRIVLDSVHSYSEWRAVREARPDSVLAAVIAPKAVRLARNEPEDVVLDERRVACWHDEEEKSSCLIAESEWCFNGALPLKTLHGEFEEFLNHYAIR